MVLHIGQSGDFLRTLHWDVLRWSYFNVLRMPLEDVLRTSVGDIPWRYIEDHIWTSSGHSRDVILPSGINVGNFSCRYFLNKLRCMSFTFFNGLPANLNILFRTKSPYVSTISASRVRPSGNEYALFLGETFHQNSSLSLYLYHHHWYCRTGKIYFTYPW